MMVIKMKILAFAIFILDALLSIHSVRSDLLRETRQQKCSITFTYLNKAFDGECVAHSNCAYLPTETSLQNDLTLCDAPGSTGICCPSQLIGKDSYFESSTAAFLKSINGEFPKQDSQVRFTTEEINSAYSQAHQNIINLEQTENFLYRQGYLKSSSSAEFRYTQFDVDRSLEDHRKSILNIETASILAKKFQMDPKNITGLLSSITIEGSNLASSNCPSSLSCSVSKYRCITGCCNNLANKAWGTSFRGFNRMLLPLYGDGISSPRVNSIADGSPLPNTRLISSTVLPDINNEFQHITLSLMSFGQFLDHDLTFTPLTRGLDGSVIKCCDQAQILNPTTFRHPRCLPISIPSKDYFYSQYGQTCMEFVRSGDAGLKTCNLSWRESTNFLTSYIDGSQIYGSEERLSFLLRSFNGGKMRVDKSNGEYPPHLDNADCKGSFNTGQFCFLAGDTRANVQPELASMHIVFLREHNRIAGELSRLQPSWTDEIVYQETRRIIGAMLQHITYNEFLPVFLGRAVMNDFSLLPSKDFLFNYSKNVDPTIFNEFATAALRVGHTLVQGNIQLGNSKPYKSQQLRNLMLQPFNTSLMDQYIMGAVSQKCQQLENFITADLTTMLFRNLSLPYGKDLPAINMQRARELGIPPYVEYRKMCRLSVPKNWNDIQQIMSLDISQRMAVVYKNIADIDLWLGIVSEKPVPGGIVGPTLACLLATQFHHLKFGDRYWYEWGNIDNTIFNFTLAQLNEIKKSSLARIMCENGNNIQEIQPLIFYVPSKWNPLLNCKNSSIPRMNFNPWH